MAGLFLSGRRAFADASRFARRFWSNPAVPIDVSVIKAPVSGPRAWKLEGLLLLASRSHLPDELRCSQTELAFARDRSSTDSKYGVPLDRWDNRLKSDSTGRSLIVDWTFAPQLPSWRALMRVVVYHRNELLESVFAAYTSRLLEPQGGGTLRGVRFLAHGGSPHLTPCTRTTRWGPGPPAG